MALRFFDSFDHYATADLAAKYTSVNGTSHSIGAYGRNGTNGYRLSAGGFITAYLRKTLTTASTDGFVVGFGLKWEQADNESEFLIIQDQISSVSHVSLSIDSAGTIRAYRDIRGTLLGTVTGQAPQNVWHYIELKGTINDTTGSLELRINGVTYLNLTNQDTQNGGVANRWNAILIGTTQGFNNKIWAYDDLYLLDTAGAVNNDFLGPVRVKAIYPDGAGTYTQMSRGGADSGANWSQVDEAVTNGDTDYVSETTAGQLDTYTFGAVGLTGNVKGVQTNLMVRSDGAGAETVAGVWRIGGTDREGTAQGVSTTYTDKQQIYDVSPDTSTAWTVSEIDGAEFGPKLVS